MQTYEEIDEKIQEQINATPELSGLTSSNASEWKLWKSVFIHAVMSLQLLWILFKEEILGYLKMSRIGRPEWYVQSSLEFQYGDTLVNDNGILKYAVVDESKRIIKQAAAVAQNGKVIIKVATTTGVLTTEEKAAFESFWDEFKPFTQPLQVVTAHPDVVKTVMIIYYDGMLNEVVVREVVNAAINEYLTSKIAFNGQFNVNRFRDHIETAIRALSDECDVEIENTQIRPDTGSYINVTYKYLPLSGRFRFGFPDDAEETDRSAITFIRI